MDFNFQYACGTGEDYALVKKYEQTVIDSWKKMVVETPGVDKFTLTFSQPVTMRRGIRKSSVTTDKITLRLFLTERGELCYTVNRRTGFQFEEGHFQALTSIEPVKPEDKEKKDIDRVKKLAKRIHKNAWDDVRKGVLEDPKKYYGNYGYTVTSITSKFPPYVIQALERAFEEKSSYRWDHYTRRHSGRDLTVETKMCEDGIFRAWFTSEYKGCGNGDYWLLINPKTAAFRERD